jgi:cation diffusion facilitator family transporter
MSHSKPATLHAARRSVVRFAGLMLIVNAAMAVVKIGVGILSGSHALLASALYSFNDLLSAIAVAVSLRIGYKKPDPRYPYGYGKAEFIAVGMVSLAIAIGVFLMFLFSALDIFKGVAGPPHVVAIALAAVSMLVSWALARRGHALAEVVESPALSTSVEHHHADAVGSMAAIIGVGGAVLGLHVLDRVVAIFETLHLIALSGSLLAQSAKGLMDAAIPGEDVDLVEEACGRVEGVEQVAFVRSRRVGSKTWIDVGVRVGRRIKVIQAHRIGEHVAAAVTDVLGPSTVTQVRFHGPDELERVPGGGRAHA